jgi:quercetin dioxygenase-like cupin family protein
MTPSAVKHLNRGSISRRKLAKDGIDAECVSVDDASAVRIPLRRAPFLRAGPHPKEASVSTIEKTSWKAIEVEKLNDLLSRQMISGENATVSQLLLKRGAVVPRHSHVNEQYSWIISGKLKFIFDDREVIVGAGEFLLIPPNVPHSAIAEEDTVDVDIFAPRREDWIRKEDAYLRK